MYQALSQTLTDLVFHRIIILLNKHNRLMNIIQERILQLSHDIDLSTLTLREIGEKVGGAHPQTVKNAMTKLKETGLLERAKGEDFFKEVRNVKVKDSVLYKIPILGSANCGTPTLLAEQSFQGFLRISNSILRKRPNLFALVASGDSMNKADLDGDTIEEGDYVIIDTSQKSPRNDDYILSIIDGGANIKKFRKDSKRNMVMLLSESTSSYPPIYIHENDYSSYFVNGKVIKVIKKPSLR